MMVKAALLTLSLAIVSCSTTKTNPGGGAGGAAGSSGATGGSISTGGGGASSGGVGGASSGGASGAGGSLQTDSGETDAEVTPCDVGCDGGARESCCNGNLSSGKDAFRKAATNECSNWDVKCGATCKASGLPCDLYCGDAGASALAACMTCLKQSCSAAWANLQNACTGDCEKYLACMADCW